MKIAVADGFLPNLTLTEHWLKKQHGMELLFTATNGKDFLLKLTRNKQLPDLVITNLRLDVMDGCGLAYYLKLHHPLIKVIALCGYMEKITVATAFLSGIDGYILREAGWEPTLLEAVKDAMTGRCYLSKELIKEFSPSSFLRMQADKEKFWQKIHDKNNSTLSNRERTYTCLSATSLTQVEIAELMFVNKRTIETMQKRVAEKLGLFNAKQLAIHAVQHGFSAHAMLMAGQ